MLSIPTISLEIKGKIACLLYNTIAFIIIIVIIIIIIIITIVIIIIIKRSLLIMSREIPCNKGSGFAPILIELF